MTILGNILNILLVHWKKVLLSIVLIILFLYVYNYINSLNEDKNRLIESIAIESQNKIDEASNKTIQSQTIVNNIKNANYNSLSNDELRDRIIKGVSNLNFNK